MGTSDNDTIAAVSTAAGAAGIGIVRVSGPEAIAAAARIFRAAGGGTLTEAASHTVTYGHVVEDGEVIDEVLAAVFRAPRTYTRQDIVEISCHGGALVLRRVLQAVLRAGARLAEPGEFTKRAFLSGRIDLSQAEAVMDLISSSNVSAARSALSHLGGALRRKVTELRARVLHETARVEAALDDPEHYDLEGYGPELDRQIGDIRRELDVLIARADEGRILRDGVATVILGRPNVGKSTLLNLLAGEERAIVTDIAGTTRDILEEQVVLGGVPLRVMDTAGLCDSPDEVEKIGVARARSAADEAELILYVIDGSQELSEQDRANLAGAAGGKVILIRNKDDLPQRASDGGIRGLLPGAPLVSMSARDGRGLEDLAEEIRALFLRGEVTENGVPIAPNLRHREALAGASEALARVQESIRLRMPEDLYTVDLMDACAALGGITGETAGEDLTDEIFSKFCMGK